MRFVFVPNKEKNDCVVMAVSTALEIPYEDAYKHVALHAGRKPNRRCGAHKAFAELPLVYINPTLLASRSNVRYPTLNTVLQSIAKGSYIVRRKGHCFVIRDGVIYDSYEQKLTSRIRDIWKVSN